MGEPQRAIRSTDSAVRQLFENSSGYRPSAGVLRKNLSGVCRLQVRGIVSDAHTLSDGPRPRNYQRSADKKLLELSRPRLQFGLRCQSHDEQLILHGKPTVESDEKKIVPRVHFGKTQSYVRTDQSVRK